MSAEQVAAIAFRALAAGRSQVVPGLFNKLYTFFGAKLPKPFEAKRCRPSVAGDYLYRHFRHID